MPLQHLHQEITITRRNGSFTFEESLARLVKDGLVEWREAHARAAHAEEFEQLVAVPSARARSSAVVTGTDDALRPGEAIVA